MKTWWFFTIFLLKVCLRSFITGTEFKVSKGNNLGPWRHDDSSVFRRRTIDGKNTVYTYLITENVSGRLGKIEYKSRCRTTFQCVSFQGHIAVNFFTGAITLVKSPRYLPKWSSGIRKLSTKVRVNKVCGVLLSNHYVAVNIFIFPDNFGDTILKAYSSSNEIKNMVKPNKVSKDATIMSGSLHRLMRMVSKENNPEAHEEMMASVAVKIALEKAINKIVETYVTRNSDEQIFYCWSLNSLFSRYALQRLATEASCEQAKVPSCSGNSKYRTFDGTCNNLNSPLLGSAPIALSRFVPAKYYDAEGLNDPIGFPNQANVPDIPPTFKVVQDFIAQQDKPLALSTIYSHALMQFGQFLDHDLDLSPEIEGSDRCMKTSKPGCNARQDFSVPCYPIQPLKHRFDCVKFSRSATECQIKNGRISRREQINVNTAFVDGSQVYGSNKMLADQLRDLKGGKGLLKTEASRNGDLLPRNETQLMPPASFCQNFGGCFMAGDVRSSEQMVLACTHTLFLREHNRIARVLGEINPTWDGEMIYQETRKIIGAVLQKITYENFVPVIIGKTLPQYTGYDPNVDPGILNSFATAAFRFGHSLIRPTFDRLDAGFNPTGEPLQLRNLFFNNTFIRNFGIDEMLLGLLGNESQSVDRKLAVGILNHLFERPHSPGLNLAALNVQRGRDHGLPGYNAFRCRCGLKNARSFSDTANEIKSLHNRKLLSQLYNDDPNLADLWIAGLAETPVNGGIVGATFACIIREQMIRTRDGDRFFYKKPGVFSSEQLREIGKASLSKIMCDNLKTIVSVQKNAFLAGNQNRNSRVTCSQIPGMDLNAWKKVRHGCQGKCERKLTYYHSHRLFYCSRYCRCTYCWYNHCFKYYCSSLKCSQYGYPSCPTY